MGNVMFMRKGEVHTVPKGGLALGDLPVGTIVNLMVDGESTPFRIINQGVPSNSSVYDASCDGTWLLAENYCIGSPWDNASSYTSFEDSGAYDELNSTFVESLGSAEQSAVKEVKIPYAYIDPNSNKRTHKTGADGIVTKAFLLSLPELGIVSEGTRDGAETEYFKNTADGYDTPDALRIAKDSVGTYDYATRTVTDNSGLAYLYYIDTEGDWDYLSPNDDTYLRPVMIFDKNKRVDEVTMTLKGAR